MSKEFEEIVLKKLDTLEVDMGTLKTEVKGINQRLDNHDKEFKSIQEEITTIHNELKETHNKIKETNNKLKETNNQLKETNNKLKETQEVVQNLSENVKDLNNRFTVFDFEINRKVDTLFDAITANKEKHDLFEKSIVSLNTKTFNHDIRISVLEDYSKNAKIFATT